MNQQPWRSVQTEVTVDAADIVLVRSELSDLLSFLALSKVGASGFKVLVAFRVSGTGFEALVD